MNPSDPSTVFDDINQSALMLNSGWPCLALLLTGVVPIFKINVMTWGVSGWVGWWVAEELGGRGDIQSI